MLAWLAGNYNDPTVTIHFDARDLNASVEHGFDNPFDFRLCDLGGATWHCLN
jgi:hypothetical protein